ncbi:MAG TPA: DUF2065 domain-containing protein [Xanthobacteraceae bacterium]|jgi:uncharacterized protein YjeT (DUF2065 family)
MGDFVAALGLVLVIEGLAFAAFPAATRRAMAIMMETPDGSLRTTGVVAAIVGVIVIWFVRG